MSVKSNELHSANIDLELIRDKFEIKFERLMCEVEFWEVFFGKGARFLKWLPIQFHLLTAD
jgi:hypothetical protein